MNRPPHDPPQAGKPPPISPPTKQDPTVAAIIRQWRVLTGRRAAATVIALSGGADSSALAMALAAATPRPKLLAAHIVHDMRTPAEAEADRDASSRLAEALGIPFVDRAIRIRTASGNAEAVARRERYRALREIAIEAGFAFLATGHHAHDQIESVLMALLRGSGPAGLSGIAPRAGLGEAVRLIRPVLSLPPADLRAVCTRAGWRWCVDQSNTDTTRLRAALRAQVLPVLLNLRPSLPRRVLATSRVMRRVSRLLREEAARLDPGAEQWPRQVLRKVNPAVLGELLRAGAAHLTGGTRRDRLGSAQLEPLIRAIRAKSTDPKSFAFGPLHAAVTAQRVTLTCKKP